MKQINRNTSIIFAALLLSLTATCSFADNQQNSGSVIYFSLGTDNPVMNESVFLEWFTTETPENKKHIGYASVETMGDPVVTEGTFANWPETATTTVKKYQYVKGFELGTSVMKEGTWVSWPNYDESMTE